MMMHEENGIQTLVHEISPRVCLLDVGRVPKQEQNSSDTFMLSHVGDITFLKIII
jgi:hypothetical protein